MAGALKLFQFLQRYWETIGICQSQLNQKQNLIYLIKTCVIIGSIQSICSLTAFLVFEANSIFEFGFGFYVVNVTIAGFAFYIIAIGQLSDTLEFVGNCERFIEKSKYCI